MRKHEILAAIVEMRFVNCKLCDKAVYSKMSDFYVICSSVVVIMFLFQPFVSSLLWEMAV